MVKQLKQCLCISFPFFRSLSNKKGIPESSTFIITCDINNIVDKIIPTPGGPSYVCKYLILNALFSKFLFKRFKNFTPFPFKLVSE